MIIKPLLGFDARFAPRLLSAEWPSERRNQFLLRKDVPNPLSVDEYVWPSLFASESPSTNTSLNQPNIEERLALHGWIGTNHGLWDDLNLLCARLENEMAAVAIPYWVIAVTYVGEDTALTRSEFGPYLEITNPTTIDHGWTFLGYDVADGAFISGLSNCGHVQEEQIWYQHLNEFHLFVDWERATEYTILTNNRVPEHAPFFTYALWRVSISDASCNLVEVSLA